MLLLEVTRLVQNGWGWLGHESTFGSTKVAGRLGGVLRITKPLKTLTRSAVGGLTAGILWPLTKWRVGAYSVGLVVVFVLSLGVMTLLAWNPLKWDLGPVLTVPIVTVIFGLYAGHSIWKSVTEE
jgi:hypothetical protein